MEYTAAQFVERLEALRSPDASGPDDYHGVGMGQIFSLARECMDMPPAEIELPPGEPDACVRVGAVSVMDFQARSRKTPEERRRELFELYLRRHDRIDTWDLVDRSAIWVVGEYLSTSRGTSWTSWPLGSADGAPDRDPRDVRVHPPGPSRRRVPDRRAAHRRREDLVQRPSAGCSARRASGTERGPRSSTARRDDAASDAPLRDREARQADPRRMAGT